MVPLEEAGGTLREMYEQDIESSGYIANYTRAMSLRQTLTVGRAFAEEASTGYL